MHLRSIVQALKAGKRLQKIDTLLQLTVIKTHLLKVVDLSTSPEAKSIIQKTEKTLSLHSSRLMVQNFRDN
jgi:hypothetical protein